MQVIQTIQGLLIENGASKQMVLYFPCIKPCYVLIQMVNFWVEVTPIAVKF